MAACSPGVVKPNFEKDLLTKVAIWSAVLHAVAPVSHRAVDGVAVCIWAAVIPKGLLLAGTAGEIGRAYASPEETIRKMDATSD